MPQSEKVVEARVRRLARRHGLSLIKNRGVVANWYGRPYMICEGNVLRWGDHGLHGLTLEGAEAILADL